LVDVTKKARAHWIVEQLQEHYPDASCALHFKTPEQLLYATILSAQCTDARVNLVTPQLFKSFPKPEDMAKAPLESIEEIIRSTGFFRAKAKSLKAASEDMVRLHGGHVPRTLDQLVELRGVGRKTANVVLGVAFRLATGIVVDTHVTRLAQRLGLTRKDQAVAIEQELMKLIPKEHWIDFSHWLIHHGRTVCKARKPLCASCFLNSECPSSTA
jgi:endonuclease-3